MCAFFLATQECKGVSSWRYYPWANWGDSKDNGQLKTVTYKKLRNDTILRVTFHSAFSQYNHAKCTEYYIKFGGHECSDPAPIINTLYLQNYGGSTIGRSYPSQISGFCNATSAGKILAGNVQISAHVKMACSGGSAYTGKFSSGRVTSYLLVEEYCSWVVLSAEKNPWFRLSFFLFTRTIMKRLWQVIFILFTSLPPLQLGHVHVHFEFLSGVINFHKLSMMCTTALVWHWKGDAGRETSTLFYKFRFLAQRSDFRCHASP